MFADEETSFAQWQEIVKKLDDFGHKQVKKPSNQMNFTIMI